jgi:hypothetical protein
MSNTGIFGSIGSLFAPDISGPIKSGLTTGYTLAQPYVTQGINAINQLYPQAYNAVTSGGQAGIDTLKNLYQMYQPTAQTYASATGGATGPGSAWDAFTKSPFYTGSVGAALPAINAGEAASGKLGSGQNQLDLGRWLSNYSSQQYPAWLNSLLPGVNAANAAAGGVASGQTNLGINQGNIFTGQAGAIQGPLTEGANLGWGYGTGLGAADAQQSMLNSILGGNLVGGLLNLGTRFLPGMGGSGGGGGGGGGGGTGWNPFNFFNTSDERLKENIEKIGETYDGLGIFKFTYINDDKPQIGLMAQEVEKVVPEAVAHVGPWKMVNYDLATRGSALARAMAEADDAV